MKYSLILLLIFTANIFALPCPNGHGFLYKGNSIEDVIQQCGEPSIKKTYTRFFNSSQELTYYKPHAFDHGYTKLIISFRNDKVSNIYIRESYPFYFCQRNAIQVGTVTTFQTSCGDWFYNASSTNFCSRIFGIGASIDYVKNACGMPAAQSDVKANKIEITELIYNDTRPQTIVFENGKLLDWK